MKFASNLLIIALLLPQSLLAQVPQNQDNSPSNIRSQDFIPPNITFNRLVPKASPQGVLRENKSAKPPSLDEEVLSNIRNCLINDDVLRAILYQIRKRNDKALTSLPSCYRHDRKLILKATLIDPLQFQYAAEPLKEDPLFIKRILKFYPDVLKFASKKITSDKYFMEHATYISRNALEYADPKITDNRPFMKKMIILDSKNYIFASNRLKAVKEFAKMSFNDDGMLIIWAPDIIKSDKEIVKVAVKSNVLALKYASKELQKDKELRILADRKSSINKKDLRKFIKENYVIKEKKKNLGFVIGGHAKHSKENVLIKKNYVTKWRRNLDFEHKNILENLHLITADSRNYPKFWKEDLKKYPEIIKKIERFFVRHKIDKRTIDDMKVTYLWKVREDPYTVVFNLYLLRDTNDADLGSDFSNVNSITAILQKTPKKWNMTIVKVIIDSEVKTDVAYANGHKKYILWDLYFANKEDKNPKLIFKVEDRFEEYFEVFEEQANGKYKMIYRMNPLHNSFESSIINFAP